MKVIIEEIKRGHPLAKSPRSYHRAELGTFDAPDALAITEDGAPVGLELWHHKPRRPIRVLRARAVLVEGLIGTLLDVCDAETWKEIDDDIKAKHGSSCSATSESYYEDWCRRHEVAP